MDLATACSLPFEQLPGELVTKAGRAYRFIDNGKSVLFVAHTDYISTLANELTLTKLGGHQVVFSSTLDDRLGMWLGLVKLQDYCDILLTTDEEVGKSTADIFDAPRTYNWMLSLDRRGVDDVAMYQYLDGEPDAVTAWFKADNLKPVRGSNSCIAHLERLGVIGFNFSVGYHNEHSYTCHAFVQDINYAFAKVQRFVAEFKDVSMPYVPKPVVLTGYQYGFYGSDTVWEGWRPTAATTMSPFVDYCEECNELWEVDEASHLCEVCALKYGASISRGDYQVSRFYKFRTKVEFFPCYDLNDVRWWGPCAKCKKIAELEYTTKRCKRCCQRALHFKPILGTKKEESNESLSTPEPPTTIPVSGSATLAS